MIVGAVSVDLDPMIRLRVVGPAGSEEAVDFVVDSGFMGTLAIPIDVVRRLGLRWLHRSQYILADGSLVEEDVYHVSVVWNGQLMALRVDATRGDPLLGTALLKNHRLTVDVVPDGPVTIAPLS